MKTLQDINASNEILKITRGVNLVEAELQELLTFSVKIDEDAENTLNAILNDAERRIEAARRSLSDANGIRDPAERKAATGRAMGHLNRTRALLDRVVKEFFPQKPGEMENNGAGTENTRDEYLTPAQAAETLGVHPSKLQSYVMGNKLRMHNHNGKWAFKGSEVQKLADAGSAAPAQRQAPSGNRADFSQYVK